MIRFRSRLSPFALLLALAASPGGPGPQEASAQELPWLERGRVRLDFAPRFSTWDHRYGVGADGTSLVESLTNELTANPLGSDALPDLRELEASLAEALGDDSYRVRLGMSQALIDQSRLTIPLHLEAGVTEWLTVGVMVPFVRPRTEMNFALSADSSNANAGRSPRVTNSGAVSIFLNQFQGILTAAETTHPGNPDLAEAQAYLTALGQAYDHLTFFPISGSSAGLGLQGRLDGFRETLSALGITGLPETVPLAGSYMNEEDFQTFLGGPPMQAAPLEDFMGLWSMGDVEITANFLALRRGFEPDSLGEPSRLRYQVGGGLLYRLGTGVQGDPNRFFDLNPSDGQNDMEGSLFGLLEFGSRMGAWGRVRYGIQGEGVTQRRIAGPGEVLPDYGRLAPLNWTPGNYLELDLSPHLVLTPDLAFGFRYHLWSKGEDSFEIQPLDPELLALVGYPPVELLNGETEQTVHEFGFSATYSTLAANARGEASLPLYLRATYFIPMAGSGGLTPKAGRFEAGLTVYRTFWGRRGQEEPDPAISGLR